MRSEPVQIGGHIIQFGGQISRNLLAQPMVSHAYLLEDGDEVILFDPSCGRRIASAIEAYIRERQAHAAWRKALVVAGHSHMDHANNLYLADVLGADETHVYVHERGFTNGRVNSEPYGIYVQAIEAWSLYFNPYRAYYVPYSLIAAPFAALHTVAPGLARTIFSRVGALPWPGPRHGSIMPEPLREADTAVIDVGGVEVRGWRLGDKVILSTPGHSPCSVSLYWPEQRALFVSDACWLGDPVFTTSSVRRSISSLQMMRTLAEAGMIETLLPGHGMVKAGRGPILNFLGFHIERLVLMQEEVLAAYRSTGEKDVDKLARLLAGLSPLFRMLQVANFPRLVVIGHNMVVVCLREEGILP